MATHISKLNKLVLQLRNTGVNIDESMVITRILTTLPFEYRHFSSSWESSAQAERTLINLTNRLLAEETRMLSYEVNESHGVAMISREKWSKSKKKPGKCFSCGRRGHWKNECVEKSPKAEAHSTEAQSLLAVNDDVALICEEKCGKIDSDSFVLDSAASQHLCYKREWFNDYVELKQPRKFTIGNGEEICAIGGGNIKVKSFNGKNWIDATIYALYAPKLYRNLFSSLSALDKGCEFRSNRSKCEFTKGGSIVAVGVRSGKLFSMQFHVKQPEKQQRYAFIEIENGDSIEANKTTATSQNITLKSVVCDKSNETTHTQDDKKNETDDEINSAVSGTASIDETHEQRQTHELKNDETSKVSTSSATAGNDSLNTPSVEVAKVDDASKSSNSGSVSSDNNKASDKKCELPKQAGAQQQQSQRHRRDNKIKDRRKSAVCDVLAENIVGSRLRNVMETVRGEDKNDGSDDNSKDYSM